MPSVDPYGPESSTFYGRLSKLDKRRKEGGLGAFKALLVQLTTLIEEMLPELEA